MSAQTPNDAGNLSPSRHCHSHTLATLAHMPKSVGKGRGERFGDRGDECRAECTSNGIENPLIPSLTRLYNNALPSAGAEDRYFVGHQQTQSTLSLSLSLSLLNSQRVGRKGGGWRSVAANCLSDVIMP